MKRFYLMLTTLGLIINILADTNPGIPPSNAILLIYSTYGTYNTQIKNDYSSYLTSIGAVIDEVAVSQGSGPGFYDELIAQQGSKVTDPNNPLKYWCQVWDLRFTDLYSYFGVPCGNPNSEEIISMGAGATTDQTMFRNYLLSGGSIFFQGEHTDKPCRWENLIAFINSVASTPLAAPSPAVIAGGVITPTYASSPENFNTDFNTLNGSINTTFYGGILLSQLGSARPLVDTGTYAIIMAYLETDLNTSAGRIVVSWESNAFVQPNSVGYPAAQNVIQNIYDLLSNSSCIVITNTPTNTPTITETFTFTVTRTFTNTFTITQTYTLTFTPTVTFTSTNTFTNTISETPTITLTYTAVPTATPVFEFKLKTNYPNPLKDFTYILYYLSRDANVVAKIFTISGEEITELKQNGIKGDNRLLWDAKNKFGKKASSGIYIYCIEAISGNDRAKEWSKMTILR